MELHHQKHHAAYVAKLNEAIEDLPQVRDRPLSEILSDLDKLPSSIRTTVRDNGGGHFNHSLFWTIMKRTGKADRLKSSRKP